MKTHKTMTLDELCTAALEHGSLRPAGYEDERGSWIVAPCGRHRESDLVDESNHDIAMARLAEVDPEGNDHAIVRFGHFAVGWIDEIIVRPGSACAVEADKIREDLDGYPILDEDHHSALEQTQVDENYTTIMSDLRRMVGEAFDKRGADESWSDYVSDLSDEDLDELQRAVTDGGEMIDGWINWSWRDADKIADEIIKRDEAE